MPPTSATITLTGTSPGTTDISQSGKLIFTNGTQSTITLTLPTCVSPHGGGSVQIAPGASTQQYTINSGASGDYNYSYIVGATADAISGTIDVM